MDEPTMDEYLDMIVSQPIRTIERAGTMLCLGIGEKITVIDMTGKKVEKSTYALHIQSVWKIVNRERKQILFASSDCFEPSKKISSQPDFDWEKFEWDHQGNNLLDEKSQIWLQEAMPVYVEDYKTNMCGDLKLYLSNDDILEVFVNTSTYTKSWILFKENDDSPQLVVTGVGYEFGKYE